MGRGSAITGQKHGKFMESFVGGVAGRVFGSNFDTGCSFVGKSGSGSAKADLAIPSKTDAQIVIEVKAFGATGSKQTDVSGDAGKIIAEIRPDSYFLLVIDGLSWKERPNDLRNLIKLQNAGDIYRIYAKS